VILSYQSVTNELLALLKHLNTTIYETQIQDMQVIVKEKHVTIVSPDICLYELLIASPIIPYIGSSNNAICLDEVRHEIRHLADWAMA
jgi:hypothetical protein